VVQWVLFFVYALNQDNNLPWHRNPPYRPTKYCMLPNGSSQCFRLQFTLLLFTPGVELSFEIDLVAIDSWLARSIGVDLMLVAEPLAAPSGNELTPVAEFLGE